MMPPFKAEAELAEYGRLLKATGSILRWMDFWRYAMIVLGAFSCASLWTDHDTNGWIALAIELACLLPIRILGRRCDRYHDRMDALQAPITAAIDEMAEALHGR